MGVCPFPCRGARLYVAALLGLAGPMDGRARCVIMVSWRPMPATGARSCPPPRSLRRLGTHSLRRWGPIDFLGAAPLARVFALDVTACPAFGGRLGLITALKDPASVRRYLQGVGLPTEPPPPIPPRAPQQEWDFAA